MLVQMKVLLFMTAPFIIQKEQTQFTECLDNKHMWTHTGEEPYKCDSCISELNSPCIHNSMDWETTFT